MPAYMLPGPGSRDGCSTVVYGPFQPGYGRQIWGKVIRVSANRYDAFTHGGPRSRGGSMLHGSFPSEALAVADIEDWGQQVMTSQALAAEFQPLTVGGLQIVFKRRASNYIACAIVDAGFGDQATWGEDGICNMFRNPGTSEERDWDRKLRLVRREARPGIMASLLPAAFGLYR